MYNAPSYSFDHRIPSRIVRLWVPSLSTSIYSKYMAISGPKPQTVFRYGLAPSQTAEFFRPEGPGSFPVAILIHGGCWLSKYGGLPQFRVLAAALSARGIATWNIAYRRADEPGGGYPGTYQDVTAALY